MTVLAVVTSSQIGIRIRISISTSALQSFYCCAAVGKSRSERQGREGERVKGKRGYVSEFGEVLV